MIAGGRGNAVNKIRELFFLAFFFSKEERLLRPLTQATPIRQRRYAALRCGAVLTATLVLCLCVAALAVGFYVPLFGRVDYGELVLPALLTAVGCCEEDAVIGLVVMPCHIVWQLPFLGT